MIVFKNDRVARDTKLYFYYLYVLEKKNIKLLSTQESFTEGSEFANIYRALLQFVAEQERKNIALRTGKGRSIKASCGGYSGGRRPYGYKVVDGVLTIDEQEAPIVKFIFEKHEGTAFPCWVSRSCWKRRDTRPVPASGFRCPPSRVFLATALCTRGMYKYGRHELG